jgi:hypothetical protein
MRRGSCLQMYVRGMWGVLAMRGAEAPVILRSVGPPTGILHSNSWSLGRKCCAMQPLGNRRGRPYWVTPSPGILECMRLLHWWHSTAMLPPCSLPHDPRQMWSIQQRAVEFRCRITFVAGVCRVCYNVRVNCDPHPVPGTCSQGRFCSAGRNLAVKPSQPPNEVPARQVAENAPGFCRFHMQGVVRTSCRQRHDQLTPFQCILSTSPQLGFMSMATAGKCSYLTISSPPPPSCRGLSVCWPSPSAAAVCHATGAPSSMRGRSLGRASAGRAPRGRACIEAEMSPPVLPSGTARG